ncbi:MAG: DUF2550 family protein [Actinomycetaceae bacterium]|nr:DUF2550 family protein [Actinomycetaceae bacterium]
MTQALGYVWMALCAVMAVAFVLLVGYTLRLRTLLARYGAVQCALRRGEEPWRAGIVIFSVRSFDWYPRFSVRFRPGQAFPRDRINIVESRQAADTEMSIVRFEVDGQAYHVLLPTPAFAGLISWMDSAPPEEEPTLF